MQRVRVAEATKGVGRPKVGGVFELVDHDGKAFTSEDMKGKYALVSGAPTHSAILAILPVQRFVSTNQPIKLACPLVLT